MYQLQKHDQYKEPWNKGKLMGQKLPLTLQEIWSIRMCLQSEKRIRDMALFNLAIDSKLRACDLLKIRVSDVSSSGHVNSRATIMQQKTQRPVRFEITSRTRSSIERWIEATKLSSSRYLFPSRINGSLHLSTRQYARIVGGWNRSGSSFLWDAFSATDKSHTNISAHQEPQSRTIALGTRKAR